MMADRIARQSLPANRERCPALPMPRRRPIERRSLVGVLHSFQYGCPYFLRIRGGRRPNRSTVSDEPPLRWGRGYSGDVLPCIWKIICGVTLGGALLPQLVRI